MIVANILTTPFVSSIPNNYPKNQLSAEKYRQGLFICGEEVID